VPCIAEVWHLSSSKKRARSPASAGLGTRDRADGSLPLTSREPPCAQAVLAIVADELVVKSISQRIHIIHK
jgi:hypothetical protein